MAAWIAAFGLVSADATAGVPGSDLPCCWHPEKTATEKAKVVAIPILMRTLSFSLHADSSRRRQAPVLVCSISCRILLRIFCKLFLEIRCFGSVASGIGLRFCTRRTHQVYSPHVGVPSQSALTWRRSRSLI